MTKADIWGTYGSRLLRVSSHIYEYLDEELDSDRLADHDDPESVAESELRSLACVTNGCPAAVDPPLRISLALWRVAAQVGQGRSRCAGFRDLSQQSP